jgi:ribosomal protein S18 acetylase RimI-like enzyme
MNIRKAKIEDSETIVIYLLYAMEDIVYKFIGEENYSSAKMFLLHFITKENNQYSYQNCWIAEKQNSIVGALLGYDGARLELLRAPIIAYVKLHFQQSFQPESETRSGEFYIDCLGVDPNYRGQGIASKLILECWTQNNKKTLGLLVGHANSNAKKLYHKLGFVKVGYKTLLGNSLEHFQLK